MPPVVGTSSTDRRRTAPPSARRERQGGSSMHVPLRPPRRPGKHTAGMIDRSQSYGNPICLPYVHEWSVKGCIPANDEQIQIDGIYCRPAEETVKY
jgi:hypothetical protein